MHHPARPGPNSRSGAAEQVGSSDRRHAPSHPNLENAVPHDPIARRFARIVTLVEQASATTAKAQLFVERIEQRYSVTVVLTTLLVFAIPLTFGASLRPTLLRAMTYMIVASTCAVVLATMPPLLSAIANAGRHGLLVKSAIVIEQLGQTTQVVFDKTGTLTQGTPHLTDVQVLADMRAEEVLRLAASLRAGVATPVRDWRVCPGNVSCLVRRLWHTPADDSEARMTRTCSQPRLCHV